MRPTGSQTSLREANRALTVEAVRRHGGITQVELAGATGLSPATVSNIVKELTAAGTLAVSYAVRNGRRAVQVTLARGNGLVVGMHVGTRHLRIALADPSSSIVAEHHMPLAPDHYADASLDRAAFLLDDLLDRVGADSGEVRGIGIAIPAPIDPETGQTAVPGLMRGWDGVDIAQAVQQRVGCPASAGNDATLAGVAEAHTGVARGIPNVLYLRASHGIGGVVVRGGTPQIGRRGAGGEIGHLSIDPDGPLCRCGNRGCLESFVGAAALTAQLPAAYSHLNYADIISEASAGDPLCGRIVADAGRHIGLALASANNLLDVDLIVVGGELAETRELLLSPVRHSFERNAFGAVGSAPAVIAGELGVRAPLHGAIGLAVSALAI